MHPEPIADFEFDAYVDGELDLASRLAVEDYLAHQPAAAAQVMADLRVRSALRLDQQVAPPPAPQLVAATHRLAGRFNRQDRWSRLLPRERLVAAALLVACVVGVGILPLRDADAAPPEFVGDAVSAYETGLLRWKMPSQIENPRFDRADVYRATRLRVPRLPQAWRITDVQIVPDDNGPALQLMVRTEGDRLVSIFATREVGAAPDRPITIRRGATSIAYWRHGDIAYALTGLEPPAALEIAARDLADNRFD